MITCFVKEEDQEFTFCGKKIDECPGPQITSNIHEVNCGNCLEEIKPSEIEIKKMMEFLKIMAYCFDIKLPIDFEKRVKEKSLELNSI